MIQGAGTGQLDRPATRRASVVMAAVLVAVGGSCRKPPPPPPTPERVEVAPTPALPPISPWPATIAAALRAAESGRYDEAERLLVEFSVKHAGTPEGTESDFWRALLKIDPSNRKVAVREQLALLDAYLGAGSAAPRYAEALILRRVVEAADSTRALMSTMRASAEAREKARDEEIKKLQDELDRTTAELERIKRRLLPRPDGR
jgi:hypothetical protein